MKDDSGNKGRDRAVIPAQDVFARLRKQNQARAEARRHLETARRTALERQLVRRILNRERERPDLHPVD